MLSQVSTWVHWGVESHLDHTTKRKILLTNIAALLAIVSLGSYALLFTFIGNPALINVIYTQIPFYPMLVLVLHLNSQGRNCQARWLLVFAIVASQIVASLISFGSFVNSYYSYILFALGAIVVFPLERWKSIAFIFVVNIGLFLYFEFNWVEPAPALLQLDNDVARLIRQLFPTTSFVSVLLLMGIVEFIAARSERRLEGLSITDPLTLLPNRRYFENTFKLEVAQSQRSATPLALAILDIDYFKQVNDTYGHDVGDQVLVHISTLLRRSTRAGNVIARVGGEEFALLLPNTKPSEALEIAERIRTNIEETSYSHDGRRLPVTVSIGISQVAYNEALEYSYKLADEALYEAKNRGRNCVFIHPQSPAT
ncbi:MAG: GGDEF domain-containing protein [Sideroxydans sp.]|nr:GGDEF domain-containing protein [Sideroxydans sp.]